MCASVSRNPVVGVEQFAFAVGVHAELSVFRTNVVRLPGVILGHQPLAAVAPEVAVRRWPIPVIMFLAHCHHALGVIAENVVPGKNFTSLVCAAIAVNGVSLGVQVLAHRPEQGPPVRTLKQPQRSSLQCPVSSTFSLQFCRFFAPGGGKQESHPSIRWLIFGTRSRTSSSLYCSGHRGIV
jgi:hypothetical protein